MSDEPLSTIHNLTIIDIHLLLVLDRQEGSTQVDVAVVTALPKKFHQHGLSVWPIGSAKET